MNSRLNSISGLDFKILPEGDTRGRCAVIGKALATWIGKAERPFTQLDARDIDLPDIRAWLTANGAVDEKVDLLWLADGTGAELQLSDVLDRWEDLYYPGADDIAIEPHSHSYLLIVDHEERLTLLR